MSPLSPCPECSRHVRASDATCPFCSAVLPVRPASKPALPPQRLGRAAIMAFGTAAVAGTLAVAGCGDDDGGPSDSGMGTPDAFMPEDAFMGGVDAAYGGPPDTGMEEDAFMGGVDAAYGGPPVDSGTDSGGGPAPAYGAPP